MRARVRTLRRVARFVLVIALVLFNAVPPIAAQTAPSVIYACIGPDGPARVIGPSETCRPNEVRVQWDAAGQQGPKGPTGDAGATGPQGPQGAQGSQGSVGGRPVLMVNGRYDRTVQAEHAERLFAAAGEPRELYWYDGGHWPPPVAIGYAADWLGSR